MSIYTYLIVKFILVIFASFFQNVEAVYENNPFFQGENRPDSTNKPVTPTPSAISANYQTPSTKEPTFTIEPPEILYGNGLNQWCVKPRGQFPSATCKNYVNCWDGVAVEQSCLGNFLFNPVKLYCDYPENVDCKGKPQYLRATSAPTATYSEFVPTTSSVLNSTKSVIINSQSSVSGVNPSLRKFCVRSTGVFPGSTCSKFVNCWNDNAVEQDCPTGLFFSREGYCDYPENVYCGDVNHNGEIPAGVQQDSDCPLEFGNFRNRSNCGQYYTCLFFKVVARYHCPDGFSFSDILGICDYSTRVDCSKEPQYIDLRGVVKKDSNCPFEFGNFRNKTNCTQYYTCAFYKVVAKYDCPEGFNFSNLLGVCDYSNRVDCNQEPQIFRKHADTKGVIAKDSDCPLEFGNFRNRTNCSQYYTCAFHKVVAKYDCPEGFNFSDILGVCDYSYRVDCTLEPQIFRKPADTKEEFSFNAFAHPDLLLPASGDNRCIFTNGLVRDRENCSSYYVCEFGKFVANYVCPTGFKFSNELGICDYEEKVNCNYPAKAFEIGSGNISIPNIPTGVLSQVQKCVPGSVFRLNPQCTSACRCRNGTAEVIQCSAGLAYDSKLDKCVLPHLARC